MRLIKIKNDSEKSGDPRFLSHYDMWTQPMPVRPVMTFTEASMNLNNDCVWIVNCAYMRFLF